MDKNFRNTHIGDLRKWEGGGWMRVLVTGGAGYIGSHTCKALARHGCEVVTLDNLSRGHRDAVRWGPLIEVDLLDADGLDRAVAACQPDVIMHFAALAYVGESVSDPAIYYRTNVVGTLNLLDAMRQADCNRILFSSTCATYGKPQYLPISEIHPQRPINPYGWSKLAIEQMLRDFGTAYGLRWQILRYFNAAGCDPEGELVEAHVPETHVIPLAIDAALGGGAFTINGDCLPTRDGTPIRDFIHVSDLAEMHVAAAQRLCDGEPNSVYNLGTGRGISIGEIVAEIERQLGRKINVTFGAARAGDPAELVADSAHAIASLGYPPCHSSLEEIITTALAGRRSLRQGASPRQLASQ